MNEQKKDGYRSDPPRPDTVEGLLGFFVAIGEYVCAVLAAPFEVILRHKIGSRYQHIVVLVLAPVVPIILVIISLSGSLIHMPRGLIGMGIFYLIVAAFNWKHYIHVIWMIMHPEKEELSREDGTPLFFMKALPKGDKWPMVRMVYEPGLLLASALILTPLHIITWVVGGYLVLGAAAMLLRSLFLFFRAWEFIRDLLDNFNASRKLMDDKSNVDSEAQIRLKIETALKRLPVNLPRPVYQTAASLAKQVLPAELQDLMKEAA